MSNKKKINDHINKAIATTVVVTAIGISSTINSIPVKAANINVNKGRAESTVISADMSADVPVVSNEGEVELLDMQELVTNLLKEGRYTEAREIRKTFMKYQNPLANELRKLGNYAVNTIT